MDDLERKDYSSDEEATTKTMQYLQYVDPKHASREDAIAYLRYIQRVAANVVKDIDSDAFEKYYEDFVRERG